MSSTDQVRRIRRTRRLLVAVLLAIGCSGGLDASGCGGGCGGEGGGCAPIPGGFAGVKANNAVTAKVSKSGFDFIGNNLDTLVEQFMGQGLSFDIPCTADSNYFVCDLNDDKKCTAADENHPDRASKNACRANGEIRSVKIEPEPHPNGGVVVKVKVRFHLETGEIPIRGQAASWLGVSCKVSIDTSRGKNNVVPIDLDLKLTVDPVWGNILAIEPDSELDLFAGVESDDIKISGSNFLCSIGNLGFVKELVLGLADSFIGDTIDDMIDSIRCRACGEPGPDQCPIANQLVATCDQESNLCYTDRNKRICPPAILGLETRVDLASLMGDFGISPGTLLDLYAVAGGLNPDGTASARADNGGLVLGIMGGSDAPAVSANNPDAKPLCVPQAYWAPRGEPKVIDYDAEASEGGFPDYKLGIGISDNFLDKSLFDAYLAGALCLEVGGETIDLLTSGLFATFLPSLNVLTNDDDVPLLIALRPKSPPDIVIGKGTTKLDSKGNKVPDDPLLTINIERLNLDFYALLEERYTRLFTLQTDVKLPLALEFDPESNSVLPVLGDLDALLTNVEAKNSKMLAEDPQALADLVSSLIGMVQPLLGDALSPFELPAMEGIKLVIPEGGARGVNKFTGQPGYEHLALFADLQFETGQPFTAASFVQAALVDSQIPSKDELFAPERKPTVAVIEAKSEGAMWIGHPGHEYSWRVNGGLWSPWNVNSRFEVASPVLRLQGRHVIEVRSRAIDTPGTVSRNVAQIPFVVDYDAPKVELAYDKEADRVLTLASDRLAQESELSYAYRVAGGNWSAFGPKNEYRLVQLGDEPSLEVKVRDPAGNEGWAVFGLSGDQSAFFQGNSQRAQGGSLAQDSDVGCSQAGASILALLGLGALMGRRRRR